MADIISLIIFRYMKIKIIDSKVKQLEGEVNELKIQVIKLKKIIEEKENNSIINIKKEIMQIDKKFLLNVLKYNDHRTKKKYLKNIIKLVKNAQYE